MRAGIDRTTADLERSRHGADDEMQRQAVIGALAQNNCCPQYVAAAPQQKGFFETLFAELGNPGRAVPPGTVHPQLARTRYPTPCVPPFNAYYFPISFPTSPTPSAQDD